jgi:hypothetical protein
MTQTLYAHMNKIKIFKKLTNVIGTIITLILTNEETEA